MNAHQVIELAKKHVDNGAAMSTSARLCLDDAIALQAQGKCTEARNRAVKSLQYSVGIFHEDYRAVDPLN